MARRFTIEILMNLAQGIGANPSKYMGTRTNISFLGKGPTKNPLFQGPLSIESATKAQMGSREGVIGAVEDAMAYATAGKLNSIQVQALGLNLQGINKMFNPPVLPSASVTPIASGIEGLKRFPRETHKFMGRPLKDKDFSEIDRMVMEGKIPDARGRTWDLKSKGTKGATPVGPVKGRSYTYIDEQGNTRIMPSKEWSDKAKRAIKEGEAQSGLPGTGPGVFNVALNQKTGMSRAIARNLLLQDTRLKLSSDDLFMLKEGKGEPLDLMQKYYGRSMSAYDDFLNQVDITAARPDEFAALILKNVKLVPQFAEGGLAEILQAPRSGYSKGRLVKSAIAILNRNKKNADYMFKASDNVSPGYAHGDLKYNAELLADQLAEDAGVLYADLGHLERTKFYGTAYDYLSNQMGQILRAQRIAKKNITDLEQKMQLSDFTIKGRKPNASGGLAGILEV